MTRRQAEIERLLREDYGYYAEHALKIVAKNGEIVPLRPKPAQQRLYDILQAQHAAGEPQRVIILKARQLGFSTATQGMVIQRATQMPNHSALVVAQDLRTASSLFEKGLLMVENLPAEIKPPIAGRSFSRGEKYLQFGVPAAQRMRGVASLNSELRVDTAREVVAGRGLTINSLHISEIAFYPYPEKLTALLNAVPREQGSLVVLESTANGHNEFKERWDRAEAGESAYAPLFAPWWEEPTYSARFHTAEEREAFIEQIGAGPFGEDEARYRDEYGCSPEQLHWRRLTIVDECDSDVTTWRQEFPASPAEAFRATGGNVFSVSFIDAVRSNVADPLEHGLLLASSWKTRKLMNGPVEVPTAVNWVPQDATGFGPRHDFWRVWRHPKPGDQFILSADTATGDEMTSSADPDFHVVTIIDHKTFEQVAEYRSRSDPDELVEQIFLAALYYNQPWVAVETTGHVGLPVVKMLWKHYKCPKIYKRNPVQSTREREQDLLGWDTNRRTKPLIEANAKQLMRENVHGIHSVFIAREMETYIVHPNGAHEAAKGKHDDALTAWMIAAYIAQEKFVVPERDEGPYRYSNPRSDKTGY